ncbi:MAG: putative Ig domain-containing protein [Planctomycetota bacterium JB042]
MIRHPALPLALVFVSLVAPDLAAGPKTKVDFDIVYVRQPRYGAHENTHWPEVADPARLEPGADLVLLRANGKEEVLVDCDTGSVADPAVSFDGKWIYYALYPDLSPDALNPQRRFLPELGADIFRIHVDTRVVEQITDGGFSPNTGIGQWDESNPLDPPGGKNFLGYGILNTGPCPLPGGRIAFTSNRRAYLPNKSYTYPNMQLFVMDEDGSNVTAIAPMSLGSALHPSVLRDGRIMFSSFESQGIRDNRLWGLWVIEPDGRAWAPIVSAFKKPSAFHFATQLTGEDVVVVDYYNQNNNGFGALYRLPVRPPPGTAPFHGAPVAENPEISQTKEIGKLTTFRMSFTPYGMHSLTPFTHGDDTAAPVGPGGERVGKFTHPSAAPAGDLLAVWTPGPANDLNRPTPMPYYDGGIVLLPDGAPVSSPDDLVVIKNDPKYNEAWPRAVVPYASIHGVEQPTLRPWLPNDGTLDPALPEGTPYGLVGSSSLYRRESFPGVGAASYDGLDPFNSAQNDVSSNWLWQGADAGKYDDSDVWAIRLIGMEPTTHLSYGPNYAGVFGRHFHSHANERFRILGEIPVRKFGPGGEPILDPDGNPDTSFLVKIPADLPYSFQTIDRNGLALNMAQTWHQVRPGEKQVNCGGCHSHSQLPLDFDLTAAAQPTHSIHDLSKVTPIVTHDANGAPDLAVETASMVDVEFYADIRPLLQAKCVGCHTKTDPDPPGNLVHDDLTMVKDLPGDYRRLADDAAAQWGHPPVVKTGTWRDANASRYVRKFQSRRSLLVWKLFGERLDGWTNEDHPTETVPGVAATLPAGAEPNDADLDFTGTIMPPPDSGIAPLTIDEKMTVARWIDLGAPIDVGQTTGNAHLGWFADDLRPIVTVSSPRAGLLTGPLTELRFGAADATSGLDLSTLSVRANFEVNGLAPETELAGHFAPVADGVHSLPLATPITEIDEGSLRVEVADHQGNFGRVDVRFTTVEKAPPLGLFAASVLPAASLGAPYDSDLKPSGGAPPYTVALTKGKLPKGLALAADGRVVGLPKKKGTATFRVELEDSAGATASTEYVLRVVRPLALKTKSLPKAKHGKKLKTTLKVTGGAGSETFEVIDGLLPDGVLLGATDGKLSGVPLETGDFVVQVRVVDASGADDLGLYVLSVAPTLKVKTKKLKTAKAGKSYQASLQAKGGVPPYAWSVVGAGLPAGLALEGSTIAGTPAAAENATITVRAVDATGETAERTIALKVK